MPIDRQDASLEATEAPEVVPEAAALPLPVAVLAPVDVTDTIGPVSTGADWAALEAAMSSATALEQDVLGEIDADVRRAREMVGSSVEELLSSFEGLRHRARAQNALLLEIVQELGQSEASSSSSVLGRFVAETDRMLQAHVDYVSSVTDQTQTMVRCLETISEKMGAIQTLTLDSRRLSQRTSLVALNAKIQATKAGMHAKGFKVIADEVQDLAQESQAFNEQIATLAGAAASAVEDSDRVLRGLATQDAGKADAARRNADGLAQQLTDLNHDMEAKLQSATDVASSVESSVAEAMRLLQFEDIVRQVLERGEGLLRTRMSVGHEVEDAFAQANTAAEVAAALESLVVRYRTAADAVAVTATQDDMTHGGVELF